MKSTQSLLEAAGAVLLLACFWGCSPPSSPGGASGGSVGAVDPAGPGADYPFELPLETPTERRDIQVLPTLGFEANSTSLPVDGTWREHPTLHDLDGDGLADLVASNREENGLNVWKSHPGQAWEPKLEGIPDNLMYGGSDCTDLDGDGDIDFVFAAHNQGLRSFLNDGQMNWTEVEKAAGESFLALDVALGNLNGDEHADAVTIAQFPARGKGALGVYFGRGNGRFDFRPKYRDVSGRSRFGVQVELLDITGDGLDDVFLTAEKGCLLFITKLSDDGEVGFEERSQGLPLPPYNMGNALRSLIPIDVDGDGQMEVAFGCLTNPSLEREERYSLGVLRWNGDLESWEPFGTGLPNGLSYSDVLTADFNGDGHSDLLVVGTGLGASIYLGDGLGGFTSTGMLEGTISGGRAAVGDIDGDGKPDVAVICGATKARPDAGAVRTFLNRDSAWK